ncbi:BREX-2 system adenine-specific DNA-methyltransferase PglX [Streptomyces sp. NBC_00083]|uniref:BREX-2 system adenine-specific DNA-methyltransferase PglX n=1 Tax=Streptomyces sp. NBC_00083 TaxID=2975647 RepID=UPI00224CCE3D|nr:BREX-2 system adenine-specific DNA-methyltransferase PglX [Streptomyces sp. NBC_00083]MCX5386196.1 BREX-2 system adenine-specific DNA-methyltransferase PglX [Streptomyces sp. NBC_00083]
MSARSGGQDGLLKDLRKQVTLLEDDLRARSESVEEYRDRLTDEYTRAYAADRTAATYESWRDERVTQVAAAWVLGCVFVRFCEDNGLIARAWLAGVGDRLKDAEDHDAAFFAANPEKNDRDWIVAAFDHLAGTNPTVAGLFDRRHNPLWEISPSYEAATALLKFWRRVDSDGELIHSFVDGDLDTRFLGDLYQDLSEHARKTYALLQTPVFVEEFILDLTLEPAVEEFGLEPVVKIREHGIYRELPAGLRTIDPACGSGHFLLGLFERLLAKWRDEDRSADDWTLIRRSLNAVHGCDKNPFAVSIARFRLLIAALKAAGARRLDTAPGFPINVAVGDSLIHGRGAPKRETEAMFSLSGESLETFFYRPEDIDEYAERCDLMTRDTYHVVVGNPPYITVKDKQENLNYRVYESCSGKYALSVPFAERLFQLAVRTSGPNRDAGYVGQITANSFMKREFGKKLIEEFFRLKVHLTHIIDTSGAYIPGHGTPTVILVGRNYVSRPDEPIRAVLGVRGEPSQPKDAAEGAVWKAIVGQLHRPGSESEWITVTEAGRGNFSSYPWSLSGGGAGGVVAALERMPATLRQRVDGTIGFHVVLGDDDVYVANEVPPTWKRLNASHKSFTTGDGVRDWCASSSVALWPYKDKVADNSLQDNQLFWPHRTGLRNGLAFGKTREQRGMSWHEHTMLSWPRTASPMLIAFACVSTHNHFFLSQDHRIHNRHAPVIKLPEGSSENEHLELVAVLNSSAACFWLKQVCHNKGNEGYQSGIKTEMWERFYEFTGTKLQDFPLPLQLPLPLGRTLDTLAQELATHQPSAVCTTDEPPIRTRLDAAHEAWTRTRQRMIALQEELDWEVYHSYGLLTDAEKARLTDSSPAPTTIPQVKLGERAFEIVLARKQAAGEIETAWFVRHGSTPVTEIPAHWPDWYRDIVQARIDTITSRRDIALIERPECKRRWATEPWEKREKAALRTWLLDKCEDKSLWFHVLNDFEQPRTLTVGQLADELENQPDAKAILNTASLYAAHLGKPNLTLAQVLQDVIDAEHVPYLAAYRYKDTGLRKRAQWEDVWEQQREEDRSGERLDIPVPPKYTSADFLKQSYWSNRGKLDVPKERFISYPDASPGSDPTLLLGWAGWDQRDQATALLNIVSERRKQQDWSGEQLVPLLAGINELMPWLRQWFGEVDDEWGEESAAEEFQSFLDGELAREQFTPAALTAWRPAKKTRARKAITTAKTAKQKAAEDDE